MLDVLRGLRARRPDLGAAPFEPFATAHGATPAGCGSATTSAPPMEAPLDPECESGHPRRRASS